MKTCSSRPYNPYGEVKKISVLVYRFRPPQYNDMIIKQSRTQTTNRTQFGASFVRLTNCNRSAMTCEIGSARLTGSLLSGFFRS